MIQPYFSPLNSTSSLSSPALYRKMILYFAFALVLIFFGGFRGAYATPAPTPVNAQPANSSAKPPVRPPAKITKDQMQEAYRRALALYTEKKYEASLAVIRSAVTIYHKPYSMRMLAAANYVNLGKLSNAAEHMLWAIKEHTRRAEPVIMLAGIYRKSGRFAKAVTVAAAGIRRIGEKPELRFEMAKAYYRLKNLNLARRNIEAALRKNPNRSEYIYLDAIIMLRRKKLDDATFRLHHALNLKPSSDHILAGIYLNLGAISELQADRLLDPSSRTKDRRQKLYSQAAKYYRYAINVKTEYALAKANLKRLKMKN